MGAVATHSTSCHGRQLLRELLASPIVFTPAGRVYQFRGQVSFGALANLSALAAQETGQALSLPAGATDVGGAHGTLLAGVLNAQNAQGWIVPFAGTAP